MGASLELNIKYGIKAREFIRLFSKTWRVRREKPQGQNPGLVNLQKRHGYRIQGKRLRRKD